MEKQAVVWTSTYERMKRKFVLCLIGVNLCWGLGFYGYHSIAYKPLLTELRQVFDGEKEMSLNQMKQSVHDLKVRGEILQYLRTKGMSLGQGLDISDGIMTETKAHNLPVDLVMGVIKTESEFSVTAKSSQGALGIMQIMPVTWNDMVKKLNLGVGIQAAFDPRMNIKVGCAKLRELVDFYTKPGRSDVEVRKLTLSAYNAGEGGGVQPGYVSKVSKTSKEFVSFRGVR